MVAVIRNEGKYEMDVQNKAFLKNMATIVAVAKQFSLSPMELLGDGLDPLVRNAQKTLVSRLLRYGSDKYEVAVLFSRDVSDIEDMITVRRYREPRPDAARKAMNSASTPPSDLLNIRKRMAEEGSKKLLRALLATGKLHGPMSEEKQIAAVKWAYSPPKGDEGPQLELL